MSISNIERDLVRWKRGQWLLVTGFVFAVQLGLFLLASQEPLPIKKVYPKEPRVTISSPGRENPPDSNNWSDLDNPFLFAGAAWHGFSGDAWLRKPDWKVPPIPNTIPVRFLQPSNTPAPSSFAYVNQPFSFRPRTRPGPVFPAPPDSPAPERKSELRIEGFPGRRLINDLPLPPEFHNDVLSSSVVEALVGPDGLVISARLIENSGSPKADADALSLALRARFSPRPGTNRPPELGKLIFEWFALDLSQTNRSINPSNTVSRERR